MLTNEEAKAKLEAYIMCESKKSHFDCSDSKCDDNCPLLYEMGTVGEHNEAINMAIKALEQEPKTGHWIKETPFLIAECSECGNKAFGNHGFDEVLTKYCPNRGARMVEIEDKWWGARIRNE